MDWCHNAADMSKSSKQSRKLFLAREQKLISLLCCLSWNCGEGGKCENRKMDKEGVGRRNCDQTNINHKIGHHAFNFLSALTLTLYVSFSFPLSHRLGLLYRAGGLLLLKLCTDGCFIVYVNSAPDTLWAYPFGVSCIVLVSRQINCYIIKRISIN